MRARVVSGIIIAALLFLILSSGGELLTAVLCVLSLIATFELYRAFGFRGISAQNAAPEEATDADATAQETDDAEKKSPVAGMEIVGYLGVLLHYGLIFFTDGDPRFFIGSMIAFFFAQTLIYVVRFPAIHFDRLADAVFIFLYAPVMLSFLYMIRKQNFGWFFVFLPFDAWVCDTCAYFSGMAFGKHKLCPQLSPKKTIEGAIGGLLGATVVAGLYGAVLPRVTNYFNARVVWACLAIGASVGVLSQLGDLLASGIKRDRGIKDYGKLIPGHGGIMDRFDSVIFVTPVVYFLIVFLLR